MLAEGQNSLTNPSNSSAHAYIPNSKSSISPTLPSSLSVYSVQCINKKTCEEDGEQRKEEVVNKTEAVNREER